MPAEGGIEKRLQHLQQRLLNKSIHDRRNAKLTARFDALLLFWVRGGGRGARPTSS